MLKLILLALISSFSIRYAHAAADYSRPDCVKMLVSSGSLENADSSPHLVQKNLNHMMAGKYRDLAVVLKDPDSFIASMTARFEAQKLITPGNPHKFDYSEIGLPALAVMRQGLTQKMAALKIKSEDAALAHVYMTRLLSEVDATAAKGQIDYATTIELSTYYARIAGYFDHFKLTLWQRTFLKLDRYVVGYHPLSMKEEFEIYTARKFSLFQPHAAQFGEPVGFKGYENDYAAAFADKDQLLTIIVPTGVALETDVLLRLASRRKVSLTGLTIDPILADGFHRPTGHFWYHDLRHQSAKWVEKTRYMTANGISEAQEPELNRRIDLWAAELELAIGNIQDPDLKAAVEFITFGLYYDTGVPVVPSTYSDLSTSHYFAALALVLGREGLSFQKPIRSLRRAEEWFANFWTPKIDEERVFLEELK